MEDAYVDLNLEEEYDHPDNRGWMNLFRHWSWSGMFCATWAISASTYGARFQRFCERHLDLHLGEVEVPEPIRLNKLDAAQRDQVLNFWEVRLINYFVHHFHLDRRSLRALALQMVVGSPDRTPKDEREMRFTFGFALVRIWKGAKPKRADILYFRVQDHLRRMGLAREGLAKLAKEYDLREDVRWLDETIKHEILKAEKLATEASLAEAIPTKQDHVEFQRLFLSLPAGADTAPQAPLGDP